MFDRLDARVFWLPLLAALLLPGCIVIQPVEPAPPEAQAAAIGATLGAMLGQALAEPEPPPAAPPPPPRWIDPELR